MTTVSWSGRNKCHGRNERCAPALRPAPFKPSTLASVCIMIRTGHLADVARRRCVPHHALPQPLRYLCADMATRVCRVHIGTGREVLREPRSEYVHDLLKKCDPRALPRVRSDYGDFLARVPKGRDERCYVPRCRPACMENKVVLHMCRARLPRKYRNCLPDAIAF
eukprot:6212712-Pleurochrysis_carterae.AAC.2